MSTDQPGVIDSSRSNIILCVGRKGSGKSVAARNLYRSWPHDKLVIDPTGNADPGPTSAPITVPLPSRLPDRGEDGVPVDLHFQPDPGSPTYAEDVDRAVGLALFPRDRRTLVWVDEIGEAGKGDKSSPHMRRLLQTSRHHNASALLCGPRPININPLMVSQADYVFVYDLPNPRDRERIADNIGYPPKRFAEEMDETRRRGDFWFLLWDSRANQLFRMPPMPEPETTLGHVQPRS